MINQSYLRLAAIPLALSLNLAIESNLPAMAKPQSTLLSQNFPTRPGLGIPRRRSRLFFKVPNVTGSGNQRSGFVRGKCSANGESDIQIKAVLPKMNKGLGLTVAKNPTVFFHLPAHSIPTAKFTVENEMGDEIFTRTLSLNGAHGIISISIPDEVPPLEVGKTYKWNFQLICTEDGDNGANLGIEGEIKREAPNPLVANQLKTASQRDRVPIYALNSWWYDSLKTLADLRRANPNDATLVGDWVDILSQDNVGLADIAREPIVQLNLNNSNPTP